MDSADEFNMDKPSQECPYCEEGTMYYEKGGIVRCENCDATRLC